MNDLDTQDPLHSIVREALLDDATDAPQLPTEWVGPGYVTVAASTPRRSGWSRTVVGAAAAVGLIATLALIARPDSDAPASAPPTWLPDGAEFPPARARPHLVRVSSNDRTRQAGSRVVLDGGGVNVTSGSSETCMDSGDFSIE